MRTKNMLIYGIGRNDAAYETQNCPFYRKWKSMMARCYSDTYQDKYRSYVGVTVCNEWHTFSSFKTWVEKQDWADKHIDKDILFPNNKIYSPSTCCFVDGYINTLFTTHHSQLPQGVFASKHGNKNYRAEIRTRGKRIYLGRHIYTDDAEIAYLDAKIQIIETEAKTQKKNVRDGMLKHIEIMQNRLIILKERINE